MARVLGSLSGTSELWVRQGRISNLVLEGAGLDIAQALGLVIRGDEALPMNCAVARVVVERGLARPELALLDTPDTLLSMTGQASLAEERLDLKLVATPHDFSPLALRTPVTLQGSFDEPRVGVEAGRIGLRAAAALAIGAAVGPAAGLLALLDFGESEDRALCENALSRLRSAAAPSPASARQAPPAAREPARAGPAQGPRPSAGTPAR